MIHLFKKVYLESDKKINVDVHRIILSEDYGNPFDDSLQVICAGIPFYSARSFGEFLKSLGAVEQEEPKPPEEGEEDKGVEVRRKLTLFDDFYEFLNYIDECHEMIKEPIIIYVDDNSFMYFVTHWYKILFPNITLDSLVFLLKRYVWYTKIFSTNELYWNPRTFLNMEVDKQKLQEIYDSIEIDDNKANEFLEKNKKFLSIEFLINSYFYNESCKEELRLTLNVLLKRNIENILGSLRQKIYSNLTQKQFLKNMNIDPEKYENFYDILEDETTILYFFFDMNIWPDKYLTHASSDKPLKYENITDKHLSDISKVFKKIEGDEWEYVLFEQLESTVQRDFKNIKWTGLACNKFDIVEFSKYFREKDTLSEEEFKKVISYDLNKNKYEEINFTYSFCSKDYSTVNNYFIDYIFDEKRKNNIEALKFYSLR